MNSREERERLKEEYKAHYRSIRETRQKLAESERMAKIASALERMNAEHLLETFDTMLRKVREKIEVAEARLEMAMDSRRENDDPDEVQLAGDQADLDETERRRKASEAVKQMRAEMGTLQDEIDNKIQLLETNKTIGRKPEKKSIPDKPAGSKTLGRAKTTEH